MKGHSRLHAESGFTLVEVLSAFAISASIIVGVGSLIHHIGISFDRGIAGISEAERFSLAMDRLSRDFASAHFISIAVDTTGASRLAFSGSANKITFVANTDGNTQPVEVVTLSVETNSADVSQLVRRTAPWIGPGSAAFADAIENTVVLLKGHYRIDFAYGRFSDNAQMNWSQSWEDDRNLPSAVRLLLRDPDTGANLVAGGDFILRADYPAACVGNADCAQDRRDKDEQKGRP